MTDDRPEADVEDRLARALDQRASTTRVSPDAWQQIEERTARARRRRSATGWVGVPALAAAVAAVLAVVTGGGGDDRQVTAAEPAPAYFVIRDVAGRLELRSVEDHSMSPGDGLGTQRVYGRRAADGLSFDATISVGTYPADRRGPQDPRDEDGERLDVRGFEATLRSYGDHTSVSWRENGLVVEVFAYGVGREELVAAVRAAEVRAAGARMTALPARFAQVYEGPSPGGPEIGAERVTRQGWVRLEPGDEPTPDDVPRTGITLTVYEGAGMSLDSIAWTMPGARRSGAAGQPALLDPQVGALAWAPRRGVVLVLSAEHNYEESSFVDGEPEWAHPFTERDLADLAARVEAIDEATWRRLVAGLPGGGSAGPLVPGARNAEVVATGGDGESAWTARAYLSQGMVCLDVSSRGSGSGGCFPAPASSAIDGVGVLSDGMLTALVAKDVAEVVVELDGADPLSVEPARSSDDLPVDFLVVQLPDGARATAVVARDASGRDVGRQPVPQPPPGEPPGEGPVPTVPTSTP